MRWRPGVSVIIPVHDAWPVLQRTITATSFDCRNAEISWEILVVDNDSSHATIEALEELVRRLHIVDEVRLFRRVGLEAGPFQPGGARNLGIDHARYCSLVFLDADCIPSSSLIRLYAERTAHDRGAVFLGHRVFIDAGTLDPEHIAGDRTVLDRLNPVASPSNYGVLDDRRLPELLELDRLDRPYNCLFGCNFALHVDALGAHRFDPVFDGFWGYEDIELGYRLHRAGRAFHYVPEAFVYHQEACGLDPPRRAAGRLRNFTLATERIPGFLAFRQQSTRPGALPDRCP
jgi:glycosyltransferase involved in cell wall biosynthesis